MSNSTPTERAVSSRQPAKRAFAPLHVLAFVTSTVNDHMSHMRAYSSSEKHSTSPVHEKTKEKKKDKAEKAKLGRSYEANLFAQTPKLGIFYEAFLPF
jgi:hypothetical protein